MPTLSSIHTTTYCYDIDRSLSFLTDAEQQTIEMQYDALNRSRQEIRPMTEETAYWYDDAGNLEHMTDPRGTVTTYEYDDMNRRIATHEDATGLDLITRYTYDRLGNQHFVTDANGVISLIDYNAFGKPVRSVQDVGGIEAETLYVYDDNLNLIAISDDNGNTTHYSYNARNQREQITYADNTTVSYTYTPLGSVDTRTNQANEIIDFDYDALGRISSKVAPGVTQSFTYTANSRLTSAQQTMSGHTTEASFDYDALGSVQEHVQTVDGLNWTTAYSYDYTAGTATATYPSGTQVVKSLDTVSRLSQVQQDGVPVAGYSYHMSAGTITQTHGNGLSTLVETDPVWRVTRLSSAVADYRYGYDNVGNRTYMQRAHTSGTPTDVYQYDNLYQLTQVWYGADATEPSAITAYERLQAYTLDPVGNRLEVENDGANVSYLPNDGQKLTNPMHRYEQVDGQVLGYDLKGNLLDDGNNTYTYDVQNQQIGMSGPGGTAEYVYDALGRRVAKVVDGVTTYFVYNAFYQVLEERDGGNQLLARYTYGAGIDEVLTMERGGSSYTYHRDALGSITEVTDAGGSLVERYKYDVYGTATIFDGSDNPLTASAIGNPYLFTARRYDPESSNYYYRARMYSSTLGRFSQMDPLGYVDGMNLYVYVGNNPLNFVDPRGLEQEILMVTWVSDKTHVAKDAPPSGNKLVERYQITLDYVRGCADGKPYIHLNTEKFQGNLLGSLDHSGWGAFGGSEDKGYDYDWNAKIVSEDAGSDCPGGEGRKVTVMVEVSVFEYREVAYDPGIGVVSVDVNLNTRFAKRVVKTDKVRLMQTCCSPLPSQQDCDPKRHCNMREEGPGVYHYYDPNNTRGPGLIVNTNDSTYTFNDKTRPYVPNPAYSPHGLCVTCAETGMIMTPRDDCSQ